MQRFFTWTCCRCAAFTGGDPGGFGHLGHRALFCCCSHHCYTSSTICNTDQVYSCILRITNPVCDKSFAWQAVHHVRRGGPVEEHHLGQLRLFRPLRFQPCKSSWWWLWCDTFQWINFTQNHPRQLLTLIGEYCASPCQWVCLACLQDLPRHRNVPLCWPHNGLVSKYHLRKSLHCPSGMEEKQQCSPMWTTGRTRKRSILGKTKITQKIICPQFGFWK